MLGYFLMPVFRAEFAVSLTPKLAEQIADSIQIEDGETVNTLAADADSVKSMLQNVIRAVGQSGLKISFSFSFSSVSFIGALFDRNPEWVDA